jgi:DNA-binding GntR family transcriptional regulator
VSYSASPEALQDEAVESRPASVVVANALREAILRGALQGGERLRQDAIATRYRVSQMIVREAFKQLVTEGFLKAERRRGVSVAILTASEAWEMTELRSLIEAQALRWAIPRMTEADLERSSRILTELDRAKSTDRLILLNARFHETLYAPARTKRTLSLIAGLRLNFERYLRFTWEETPHLKQSQQEHWHILELCKKRDIDDACNLLKRHVSATGDLLVQRLRARHADPSDPLSVPLAK